MSVTPSSGSPGAPATRGNTRRIPALSVLLALAGLAAGCGSAPDELLNASYDATRAFYRDYNRVFEARWRRETGRAVRVRQSHGGSGKQARAVLDGLPADVVTLALAHDIDVLARAGGPVSPHWADRLPRRSAPCVSTVVLLVRRGNPKGIRDWEDLARPDVAVITPNPKTSGGARWNYLAAWGYALRRWGDADKARGFVAAVYRNAPVLDPGSRAAAISFVQRGMGDVLVCWENEARLILDRFGHGRFSLVMPSASVLAEPPVAWVDRVVAANGREALARAYLEGLYSDQAQALARVHHFRTGDDPAADGFPAPELFTVEEIAGGWEEAQRVHFEDGGVFDGIFERPGR